MLGYFRHRVHPRSSLEHVTMARRRVPTEQSDTHPAETDAREAAGPSQGGAPIQIPLLHEPRVPDSFENLFSISRLRLTCATIRREVRQLEARDVLDWLDWWTTLEKSIGLLRDEVLSGQYSPSAVTRYELPKGNGSFRTITALNIRDAIVYRHISDAALEKALPSRVPGAFFSRRHSLTPVGELQSPNADTYEGFWVIWLRYQQYRTRTLLNAPYHYLVTADISNYFDSVEHDLLIEYLSPLGLPRKAMGLLGRLLEAFKPPAGHSPNPRVGLPVDELDCSRQLAHLFLFEHDHRIADAVGEANYVRWMDDQNIGVETETHARRIVNLLTRSLATQRLTLNTGKVRFLNPGQVVHHFQLDANEALDEWQAKHKKITIENIQASKDDLHELWNRISQGDHVGEGNWDKILKRLYALGVLTDSDYFESRSLDDLIKYPELSSRIFRYFAQRNRGEALIDLFAAYCDGGENLFESVESAFFEAALLLDPDAVTTLRLRRVATAFARGKAEGQADRPLGRASAILLLYWCGEEYGTFASLYNSAEGPWLPKEVARAWMACAAALEPSILGEVRGALLGHPADDVARLSRFLADLLEGRVETVGSFKSQKPRWPLPGKYYDTRSWLALDLSSRGTNPLLRDQLRAALPAFSKLVRSAPEKRISIDVGARLT
jgi:hypothetical protein